MNRCLGYAEHLLYLVTQERSSLAQVLRALADASALLFVGGDACTSGVFPPQSSLAGELQAAESASKRLLLWLASVQTLASATRHVADTFPLSRDLITSCQTSTSELMATVVRPLVHLTGCVRGT